MREFVGVIVVKDDGSVLAQHRDNKPEILGPNTWAVLGGAKEETDKNLKETGLREIEEETGYRIKISELHFLTEDSYVTEKGKPVKRTIFVSKYDPSQQIECFEGQEIRFLNPEEISKIELLGGFYTGHSHFFNLASAWVKNQN